MTSGEHDESEAWGSDPEYLLVVNPDTDVDINQAMSQLDRDRMTNDSLEELFPDGPRVGICRICGLEEAMTREHIPPRGAFNRSRGRSPTVMDWYRTPGLVIPDQGLTFQGGVSGYVLCRDCNHATGRWGREYQDWAYGAASLLTSLEVSLEELDGREDFAYASLVLRRVYPGRFVRQLISIVLSASGSRDLGERHPELRSLALGGPSTALPDPLRLFLVLYAGPMARFAGGPWGQPIWSETHQSWNWVIEVAFPPFGIQLLIDGSADLLAGVDVSHFTELDLDSCHDFEIQDWMIGFGHLPHPLEYRPRRQLEGSI